MSIENWPIAVPRCEANRCVEGDPRLHDRTFRDGKPYLHVECVYTMSEDELREQLLYALTKP